MENGAEMPGQGRGTIGTSHIVFFVVAAAAPLTAVLGVSPVAFAFGNGPGVPFVYLLVGALYILFSVGFTAMSPYVTGAAGFYAYVTAGLGPRAGSGIAAMAIATYQAIAVGAYGLFGFFAAQTLSAILGWSPPWWVLTLPMAGAVHFCGRRTLSFGANLLAVCMLGEVAILMALGITILAQHGGGSLAIAPATIVFGPGLGVAIVFVVASFIGFEATVIFGEEARDPTLNIPRATYIAVTLIALFYGFSTWTITLYYGSSAIKAAAIADPGNLYLMPVKALLGKPVLVLAEGLLLTSVFAAILSFHATIARYLCGVAREGLCDARLGVLHPVHGSPYRAGLLQTLASIAMVLLAAMLRVDPYSGLFAWAGAFASLGVLVMQFLTSVAVLVFFRGRGLTINRAAAFVAPLAAAIGLVVALALSTLNLGLIAGTASKAVFLLPLLLFTVGAAGWARQKRIPPDREDVFLAGGQEARRL